MIPIATKAERAAAKKRSDAAKKAAATRKRQAEEEAAAAARASGDDGDNAQSNGASPDASEEQSTQAYQPRRRPLANAGLDQEAAEEQRQAELAEERRKHNERTGDPSLPTGFKY